MSVLRSRRRLAALAAAAALPALLAGCTLPDVSLSPGFSSAAAATTAPPSSGGAATSSATPRATTPTRPSGDLDTGTVTHSLPAGARTVVVDYWTTDNAKLWRAGGTKTIQVSAHVEGGGTAATVEVTRFVATADDGSTRTTAAQDDGQFVITPPFSYSNVVSVLPSSARSTGLTLYVQFDLLVETAKNSGQFFRQTVLDTLKLPFLPEVSS